MVWWLLGAVAAVFIAPRAVFALRMFVGWRCVCGQGRVRWHSGFSDYTIHRGRLAPLWRAFWKCRACGATYEERHGEWQVVTAPRESQ